MAGPLNSPLADGSGRCHGGETREICLESEAAEVLQSAQAGDAADFNRIVLAYRSRVMATVGRMIGRPEDTEDVTQEVFTRLYFTLNKLREPAAFELWLHRMTINAAYDYPRGPRGRSNRRESRVAELSEEQLALIDAAAARRTQLKHKEHERVANS
jgi:RNA polymerase sigma-70 factor (ECF subfamily)